MYCSLLYCMYVWNVMQNKDCCNTGLLLLFRGEPECKEGSFWEEYSGSPTLNLPHQIPISNFQD